MTLPPTASVAINESTASEMSISLRVRELILPIAASLLGLVARRPPCVRPSRAMHNNLISYRLALDVKVIKCPSPLNVLKDAYDHSG